MSINIERDFKSLYFCFNLVFQSSEIIFSFLLLFAFIQPTFLQAQHEFTSQISGEVIDASTGKPLYFANVFLNGTTYGDATNKNGRYIIKNVPPGTYQIVASMMGYEIQKKTFQLYQDKNLIINFYLKPKILQGEDVVVTAEDAKEWRENLKIFQNIFFGVKEFKSFAKECKLLNPEVLDFKYDRESGRFQAFASEPLRFINNALGYEIIFYMKKFKARLYNNKLYVISPNLHGMSFKRGDLILKGIPQFKELTPRSQKEKIRWRNNRLMAYNGSKRHFFKALINHRLKEEGFEIRGAKNVLPQDEYKVDADTLLKKTTHPFRVILSFPDLLKVTYKNERDNINYQINILLLKRLDLESIFRELTKVEAKSNYQISWLRIGKGNTITITTNGVYIPDGSELIVYGYWGWDSPSEWLPSDYEPFTE